MRLDKTKLILIFVFALIMCFALAGCGETAQSTEITLKKIELTNFHEGVYYIGDDIDLGEIRFTAIYSDGKEESNIAVDDTMLSDEDKNKFFTPGTHTITINYAVADKTAKAILQITVEDVEEEGVYLAIFYSLGGTKQSTIATDSISAFPIPIREGYTFAGWYTNLDFSGNKAREPYALSANTKFYARWIDNRICNIKFYDNDKTTLLFSDTVHYGESYDVNLVPYENVEAGKSFISWSVTNGDPDEVTGDLIVIALVSWEQCTVFIQYFNSSNVLVSVSTTLNYGSTFDFSNYTLPTKEGHNSKWVIYYDHAEETDIEDYNDVTSTTITLRNQYTSILPYYEIYTYDIVVWDGVEEQNYTALKSGNIELQRVYLDSTMRKNIFVEWNGRFAFSYYTQNPDISQPQSIYGYSSVWCYVVQNENEEEIWLNTSGYYWDNVEEKFKQPSWWATTDETENMWYIYDEYDASGIPVEGANKIALVKNKVVENITGSITCKAKYMKNSYNVTLTRVKNGAFTQLMSFTVKYYSDFNPYLYAMYDVSETGNITGYTIKNASLENKITTGAFDLSTQYTVGELEKFYLLENTNYGIKQMAADIYSTGETNDDYTLDDWSINWYKVATCTSEDEILFANNDIAEITADTTFYCSDTDNRMYKTIFYYGFSFADYLEYLANPSSGLDMYGYSNVVTRTSKEKESITAPITSETLNTTINDVQVTYTFLGWFTTPFSSYLETGYRRGSQISSFSSRTNTQYLYAHYSTSTKYTITLYDVTQSGAYIGVSGQTADNFEFTDCTTAAETLSYTLTPGTLFDVSIMFKGSTNETLNSVNKGQIYYNNYLMNKYYQEYVVHGGTKSIIDNLFTQFNLSDLDRLKTALNYLKSIVNAIESSYLNSLEDIYNHDYTNYTYRTGTLDDAHGDFNYLLTVYPLQGTGKELLSSFGSSFSTFYNKFDATSGIKNAMNEAGYSDALSLFLTGFSIDDFITEYIMLLEELYGNAYTSELISYFKGITKYINGTYSASCARVEANFIASICDAYISFINEVYTNNSYVDKYGVYTHSDTISLRKAKDIEHTESLVLLQNSNVEPVYPISPLYATSYVDINAANGFDVYNDEIKYQFSGWYTNAAYSTYASTSLMSAGDEVKINGLKLYVRENAKYYAKWTDITKGTEGLVYEEVELSNGSTTSKGYVLVDFVNSSEYATKGYGNSEYYYVTTNDAGDVPTVIESSIELQMPSTIDKYSEDTNVTSENWESKKDNLLIYDSASLTYIGVGGASYSSTQHYYVKEVIPVVGIAKTALGLYASNVTKVTIPLNLYFIQQGAFSGTKIETFERMEPTGSEVALSYVIIDDLKAIYQWDGLSGVFTYITGQESNENFITSTTGHTIIGYATRYNSTSYELYSNSGDYTEHIGAYAFFNANMLTTVLGVEHLVSINEGAFSGATNMKQLGSVANTITIPASVVSIGNEVFKNATEVVNVVIADYSELDELGANVFMNTKFINSFKVIRYLELKDVNGRDSIIILGFSTANLIDSQLDSNLGNKVKYDKDGNEDNSSPDFYYGVTAGSTLVLFDKDNLNAKIVIINTRHVLIIANNTFMASTITSLSINTSVKYINAEAFKNCTSLNELYLGDMLYASSTSTQPIVLGDNVFYGCTGKISVEVGSSVNLSTAFSDTDWINYYNEEKVVWANRP